MCVAQTVSESVMSDILGPYAALLVQWSLLMWRDNAHPFPLPSSLPFPLQEVTFHADKAVEIVASHLSLTCAVFN